MKKGIAIGVCLIFLLPSFVSFGAENKELDQVQKELDELKEDLFRSKARTLLLEEFLVNTEVKVYFRNATRKDYRLKSALYILDQSEIYKTEYEKGAEPKGKEEHLIFTGVTTPGRHEISVVLTYEGKKTAGYTEHDYEFQVTGDFAFVAERNEITVITLTAIDRGLISSDTGRFSSSYQLDWDVKVETQELAELRRRIEKRTIGVGFESGILFESFEMVSDRLSIKKQNALLVPAGVKAYWWFLPYLGVEAYYDFAAWNASSGTPGQDVSYLLHWFGLDAKLRYAFGRSIRSPVVWIQVGYNFFLTDVDHVPNPGVRLSDSYEYLDVGIGSKIPFTNTLGFQGDFRFFPYVDLDEKPVTSGRTGNTKGMQMGAGFYWNFWRDLTVDLGYRLIFFDNDFTGRATRTDSTGQTLSLVQSRAVYQGALLGLRYEF